jgi:PIN like domain
LGHEVRETLRANSRAIMVWHRRQLKERFVAKPPDLPVFFVDRSLGKVDVPNALRGAGHQCVVHDEHFDQQTEDAVWLNAVAARRWIVLTKDERIRYRPLELKALESARLRAFIMICGNVRGVDTAAILLKAMPKILDIANTQRGPFIYYIYKDSTMKRSR